MRNRVALYSATTEILLARGSEFATAGFTRDVYSQCLNIWRPTATVRNACALEADGNVHSSLAQGNCVLAMGLTLAPTAIRTALSRTEREAMVALGERLKRAYAVRATPVTAPVTTIERRGALAVVAPKVAATRTRADLVKDYLDRNFITPEQNRAYVEIAESLTPEAGTVFFDAENAVMKTLNDRLRDKNLVTSLTNLHKQTVIREMRLLQARNPKVRAFPYSDFKSVRYAFRGEIPANFETQVAQAFERANARFAAEVRELGIVRASDDPADWFRFGYGETSDRANLAARAARDPEVAGRGTTYAAARSRLEGRFVESRELRKALETNPRLSILLEGEAGQRIPTREVFDLIRKNDSPAKLTPALRARFGNDALTESDAGALLVYARRIDEFSPGINVIQREVVNLDTAANGGYSVDFLGLGSSNQSATARALAQSGNIDAALVNARLGERQVTTDFRGRLDDFRAAAGSKEVKCSGDDCMGIVAQPQTAADRQALLDRLSQGATTREVRVAFIRDGIRRTADRTTMSTHGESVEKFLRKNLEGALPRDRMRSITFGIDMRGRGAGQGDVGWLVGIDGVPLTDAERAMINTAMVKSVEDLNAELRAQGTRAAYRAAP